MEDLDAASPLPAMADPDAASLEAGRQVPITVMLGPVGPLLRKLHGGSLVPDLLTVDEIRLLKEVCISLTGMSEDEDASFMARRWMKMVRELCYDTEDQLVEVIDSARAHEDFSELLAGAKDDFSGLIARAKEASGSRNFFQWSPPNKDAKDADPGEAGVSFGRSTVGAVEIPTKLVELLALGDDDKTLKVIPINGCAGVGKTTVARSLYHRHAGKFQCQAFVTVSRNPYTRGFLTSMLSQLKAPRPTGFPDVPKLIDAISKHLQGKRYFIVIDDLWTASIWHIISHAFPRGDSCSRIITTTQIDDVALACCGYYPVYIYKMEPLNDYKSLELFFGIKEVSNTLKKKLKHKQYYEQMKDVLDLIYSSLPPCLRTCLLYLSMYQQGYVITKDELVKHWVAEGFLSAVGGQDTQEIAEDYFDELVSRGMVQAVDSDNNGKVLSCSVHQIVLDFIRRKSREENFVITVDYLQSTLAFPDKVRRLSVQFGGVKSAYILESIVTSQVRSLIFWGFFKCVPSIMDCGLLRILILHIWADEDNESFDLTGIGELGLLKYLEIECNITVKLPKKDNIPWLQQLETLQVDARLSGVPLDIVNMKRLLHLRLPSEYVLPSIVAQMTSLRTLGYFDVSSHTVGDVLHLVELTNLQDLQLTCSMVQPAKNLGRNVQHLGSILEKLSALQSLTLVPAASGSSCVNIHRDGFRMASPPPDLLLQRIEVSRRCCIFFSLPKWFGELRNLCILKIAIRRLSMNDTDMLKGLPALTALTLYIQTVPADRIVIKEGFQVLTYFKLMCATPCMSFGKGAMPKVQKLTLGFNANQRRSYTFGTVAFSHLTGLTEVSVKLGVQHADDVNIKVVESALEDAFKHHPNTVMLRVQCVHVIFYREEHKSTTAQEAKKKITEIQEDKKEITESLEKHVSKLWSVESRYARKDLVSIEEHHTQSVSVDLVMGAFGSILRKLPDLKRDEYTLLMGTTYSFVSLREELKGMQANLRQVATLEPVQLDDATRMWANEVREFSYDAEDAIDSITRPNKEKEGFLRKAARMMNLGWTARPDIAHPIDDISKTAEQIQLRGKPLIDGIASKANASKSRLGHRSDQWMHPRFQDPNGMIGVEVSRDEVIGMLKQGTSAEANKQTKIVSIVGIGGLGKTTLAKAVYDRIQAGYTYNAFVSVSRNPDMKMVFMDILLQIDNQKYMSLSGATVDATQLIGVIRGLLANKRYLFVVDDIWHEESWEIIKNILIENEHQNVVVTTTRIVEVAERADGVYKLTALSHSHSEELFNKRLFGSKGNIPNGVPMETETLLHECGGVPLAIIAMAVLLAGKPMDCWSRVREDWFSMCKSTSFSDQRQGNDDIEANTRAILLLIYYELPDYLRTCLLYLGIFPDNYAIQKETLVWKWVAEGLVDEESERGLFEKGETLFSELIHSSLIMPIVDSRRQIVTGCRLHGLVLDMIRTLSTDVNFVTVLDGNKQMSPTDPAKRKTMDTDRRIAVQTGATEKGDPLLYTNPERLRSFNATECHFVTKLPLARFGVLRVLALEECTFLEDCSNHLKHLGKLHLLRYLGLYNTPIKKLPGEIGDLISLQTLDLRGTTVKNLPQRVVQLRQLKCLRADERTTVPRWMGNLTSLEELRLGVVGMSGNFARELGKLTELRELEFKIERFDENSNKVLVESMSRLQELQVLRLTMSFLPGEDANWEGLLPPRRLRDLRIASPGLPAWINPSLVPCLSHLSVEVKAVEEQDLENLGLLQGLVSLELLMPSNVFLGIKGDGLFPSLRYFCTSAPIRFLPGAMPRLESFRFKFYAPDLTAADYDFGTLGNLPLLQKVEVEISSISDVEAVHEAVKRVDQHPNRPSLHVIKPNPVGTAHRRPLQPSQRLRGHIVIL